MIIRYIYANLLKMAHRSRQKNTKKKAVNSIDCPSLKILKL